MKLSLVFTMIMFLYSSGAQSSQVDYWHKSPKPITDHFGQKIMPIDSQKLCAEYSMDEIYDHLNPHFSVGAKQGGTRVDVADYYKSAHLIENTVQISVVNLSYRVNQIFYVTIELSNDECLFGSVYKIDSSGNQIEL